MRFTTHYGVPAAMLLALAIASGCENSDEKTLEKALNTDSAKVHAEISADLINEVMSSIPSPVEMESMIRNVEPNYKADLLNPTQNTDKYSSNYQKAFNIGVFGTDLGYINMYDQKQDAITYLNAMTKLAEDLKVGQFFDYHVVKQLATNSNNLDSLLYITTNNFNKMNNYLQEQNRSNLSMMMLTGGWMEALYIASSVAEKNNNPELYDKIGEQKVVLDQLKILVDFYKADPKVADFSTKLDGLKAVYDSVKIVYEYHEPTVEIVNGVKMVTDNSKSTIKITKSDIDKIHSQVAAIRNALIQ